MPTVLEQAREAHALHDFLLAHELFTEAREELEPDDLQKLGDAAFWLGLPDEAVAAAERCYHSFLELDRVSDAAMAALEAGYTLVLSGQHPQAGAWFQRADEAVAHADPCPAHAYLAYVTAELAMDESRFEDGLSAAERTAELAEAHGIRVLVAASTVIRGRALIKLGQVPEGLRCLDEGLLMASEPGLKPDWVGNLYCNLISTNYDLADFTRMRNSVDATERWLEHFPVAVLFSGICRVHRVQLWNLQGEWDRAVTEAETVATQLRSISVYVAGEAHYELGELHRMRGNFVAAEAEFTKAHALGRDPQPGLALVRLAQGRVPDAAAALRTALASMPNDPLRRARLLPAGVRIALANGKLEVAASFLEELDTTALHFKSPGHEAAAKLARGELLAARGEHEQAIASLRQACDRWRNQSAAYQCAQAQLLIASCCRQLGDKDTARREIELAKATLERLGIAQQSESPLTKRETEVLRLVTIGQTNRQIAKELFVAEKTVARHLENIYAKLGVNSRTAAATLALREGLTA